MSTYWGYYCTRCGQESEHWYNHGQEKLRRVLAMWPHVKAITDIDADTTVSVLGSGNPWPFLSQHDGHPLVLSNEYGQRWALDATPSTPAECTLWFVKVHDGRLAIICQCGRAYWLGGPGKSTACDCGVTFLWPTNTPVPSELSLVVKLNTGRGQTA